MLFSKPQHCGWPLTRHENKPTGTLETVILSDRISLPCQPGYTSLLYMSFENYRSQNKAKFCLGIWREAESMVNNGEVLILCAWKVPIICTEEC